MSTRIKFEDLPWKQLEEIGITQKNITGSGNQERLTSGMYTSPLNFYLSGDNRRIEGEAAVRVYQYKGEWRIDLQTIAKEPKIESIFGVKLTEEQKESLLKFGHAGSLVEINNNKLFVSLNPHTKRLVTYPAEFVKAIKNIGGISLTADQQKEYVSGKIFNIREMRNKNGESFSADVVFSAYDRKPVFIKQNTLKEEVDKSQNKRQGKQQKFKTKQDNTTEKKKPVKSKTIK